VVIESGAHCKRGLQRRVNRLVIVRTHNDLSIMQTCMLQALGFGLFLLIVLFLMPTVFTELVHTLVVFLQSSQQALTAAGILASYAGHIPTVY
jgi:hypothetical protein